MPGKTNKFISLLLVFAILFGSSAQLAAEATALKLDGSQSSWAETELAEAYSHGLTYPGVMNNFKKNITREEFCILAIKLYEGLAKIKAEGGLNPFTDTSNEEIIKAYHLGIVKGTSATQFSPYKDITRQEICVMIHRTLNVSLKTLDSSFSGDFPFTDQNQIASWAIESVKFAYKNQIMKGIGENLIGPLQNTTREQAIVLMKRTYVNFSGNGANLPVQPPEDNSGTIPTYKPGLVISSPLDNYQKMVLGSLFHPIYDKRLTLYASTGEGKPLSKPSTGLVYQQPINLKNTSTTQQKTIYTDSTHSAFIDKDGDTKRWFFYSLNNAAAASKIIWQVSKAPFTGFEANWRNPPGLVGSGEVGIAANEFQIDFANLKISTTSGTTTSGLINTGTINTGGFNTGGLTLQSKYKPITSSRTIYYVRAIPVDGFGKVVGDPGKGLAVIYGEKVPEYNFEGSLKTNFQLWVPQDSGGFGSGEYPNYPSNRPVFRAEPGIQKEWLFHFNGLDPNTKKIVLQFSTEKFSTTGGAWPNTPNIIYEKEYNLPVTLIHSSFPNTVLVDISQFVKSPSLMKQGDMIKYYVRGLGLKDSLSPGEYELFYSSPITMEYGFNNPITYYSDDPYKSVNRLNVSMPDIKIKSYTAARWPETDYMERYYVYRAPKWDEIKNKFKNSQTGEILYPYASATEYYKQQNINNPAEYEAKVIPRVLSVGTKVHIPKPTEADKAWYQQLFEGVVNFFKDLGNIVKTIVNQISNAYARLKEELIMFIVELCPVESLKGYFKAALEAWVNYGLMWLGIPPTLPNFDQLAEMSLDYYAQVVLTETGIPQNEWTEDLIKDVTIEMGRQLDKAANYADRNPIDAPFLKLDPDFMYRPAYLDIEVKNNTIKPTVPGMIELSITFEMDYSNMKNNIYPLSYSVPNNFAVGSGSSLSVDAAYRDHFENGLNGFSVNYAQGYRAVYDVFDPMKEVKVPTLQKSDSTLIRVYLEPFSGSTFTRYPGAQNVISLDFEHMYFHNGNKKFTYFNMIGRFPTADEYLLENPTVIYLDPEVQNVYYNQSYFIQSDRLQKPVSISWTK